MTLCYPGVLRQACDHERMRFAVAVGGAAILLLSGCSSNEMTVGTCVSWADVSDPQDAFDSAEVVVVGTAEPSAKTASLYGVDAAVHTVNVTDVISGGLEPGSIEVVSTPVTCTGDEVYPDGDPLDVDGEVIVFLGQGDIEGTWSLTGPRDTVLPLPADGSLPFDTHGG